MKDDNVENRSGDMRRILRNGTTLIVARISTKIATTFLMIFIARKLGDTQFGVFSSLTAFVALFAILAEFGLTVPLIRKIARREENPGEALGRIVGIKTILGTLAIILLWVSAAIFQYPSSLALLFGVSMFFEMQAMSVTRSFEGFERMEYVALLTVIERTILCAAGFIVLYLGMGLFALGIVYVFTYIVVSLTGILIFQKCFGPLRMRFTHNHFFATLRLATPFAVAALFSVFYNRADIFILTVLRPASEIGRYSAAFRVIDAQTFIPMAIVSALFPALTRYYYSERKLFDSLYARSFLFLFGLGILISIGTYFFSGTIIRVLYGDHYAESAGVLQILSMMLGFYFVNMLLGNCLIAAGRESLSTRTLIVGGAINVLLNVLLVPKWNSSGAAVARVGTEFLACILQALYLSRVIGPNAALLAPWRRKIRLS